jgi:hypothetical protein
MSSENPSVLDYRAQLEHFVFHCFANEEKNEEIGQNHEK